MRIIKIRFVSTRAISVVALMFISLNAFSQQTAAQLDDWNIQVNNQFRHYEKQLNLSNQSHEVVYGSLDDDSYEWVIVDLAHGYTYDILGVCDHDCPDLDLKLYSDNMLLLDEDVASDDYPVVSVTPTSYSQYRVQVIMASCSQPPCRYGLAVYRKE